MKGLVLDPFPTLVCEVSRSVAEKKINLDSANVIESNNTRTVFVKRPHLDEFLERVSKLFILMIVTTRKVEFAANVINALEAAGTRFTRQLYYPNCKKTVDGKRVKDLRALLWPVDQIIAIDNSCRFDANSDNVVVIPDFGLDDDNDQELLKLLPLLERLAKEEVTDVRPVILDHYRLKARKRTRVPVVSTPAPNKEPRLQQSLPRRRPSKADKGKSVVVEREMAEAELEVVMETDVETEMVEESDMEQPEVEPDVEEEAVAEVERQEAVDPVPAGDSEERPRDRVKDLARILLKILRDKAKHPAIEMKKDGYAKVDNVLKVAGFAPGFYKVGEVMQAIQEKKLMSYADRNGVLYVSGDEEEVCTANGPMDDWFKELGTVPFAVFGTTNQAVAGIIENGLEAPAESHLFMGLPGSKAEARMRKCEALILIDFRSAANEGIEFFVTENGILLTDNAIPPQYLAKF